MGCCNESPSSAVVLRNAASAGARVVRSVVAGKTVAASPVTVEARRVVCMECEFCKTWEKDDRFHRCAKCGCWLDGKYLAKLRVATERCPLGKWEAQ